MKKLIVFIVALCFCISATNAQKKWSQPFSPDTTFMAIYKGCLIAMKDLGYVLYEADSIEGAILAKKIIDGNEKNLITATISLKKYEHGDVLCMCTISKEGKVEQGAQEIWETVEGRIGELNGFRIIRFPKNYKG